jgi:hypothetical protein
VDEGQEGEYAGQSESDGSQNGNRKVKNSLILRVHSIYIVSFYYNLRNRRIGSDSRGVFGCSP